MLLFLRGNFGFAPVCLTPLHVWVGEWGGGGKRSCLISVNCNAYANADTVPTATQLNVRNALGNN